MFGLNVLLHSVAIAAIVGHEIKNNDGTTVFLQMNPAGVI